MKAITCFGGLFGMVAVASCALGGPSERDIESAVAAYFEVVGPLEGLDPDRLHGARIVNADRCTVVGASHVCPVELERRDGTRLLADVWLAPRYPNGWTASSVVPVEPQ